jgi:hypothetical protein
MSGDGGGQGSSLIGAWPKRSIGILAGLTRAIGHRPGLVCTAPEASTMRFRDLSGHREGRRPQCRLAVAYLLVKRPHLGSAWPLLGHMVRLRWWPAELSTRISQNKK